MMRFPISRPCCRDRNPGHFGRGFDWRANSAPKRSVTPYISDSRCLRPAIRPIRRGGHDPMLIQKLKELRFQTVVRKRLHPGRRRLSLADRAGGAVALADDLAIATVQQSLPPPVGT